MDLMGIWGYEGYVGMRITYRGMWDMRDGPPTRNHPGRAAVFGTAPPNPQRAVNGSGKRSANRKKNAFFHLNC